jgi:hypothetical protein
MVYLPTQPNAPGGHSRLTISPYPAQVTIGPKPPEVAGPPAMPVPHPAIPAADISEVRTSKSLPSAAVNQSVADRTKALANRPTPQPSAAPPNLQTTGKESAAEARAKLIAWTLAGDVGNVIRQAFWGSASDAKASLETLKADTRRMLGNSFAGGMIVGAAEEGQHLITTGRDLRNMGVMVVLLAAHAVPAIAAPLDVTLALIGGSTAMRTLADSCRNLQEGNNYGAGVNLSKTLLNLSLGNVARIEATHAHHAMTEAKLVTDSAEAVIAAIKTGVTNPAAIKKALIGVMGEVSANKLALRTVLRSVKTVPSHVKKGAHTAETAGKVNGHHHDDHGQDEKQAKAHAPQPKPAAHH